MFERLKKKTYNVYHFLQITIKKDSDVKNNFDIKIV